MKKIIIAMLAAIAGSAAMAAAAAGNCESKAVALKGAQTVTLVNEWDPDLQEYSDSGVYYYTVTLSKGTAYSIWLDGGNAASMELSVYTDFDKEYYTEFESGEINDIQYARLAAGDWDEDDPSKVTFFVQVSGDIGMSATLNAGEGYRSFVPTGSEDNPRTLNFGSKPASFTDAFVDGYYYMSSRLTANRMYRISTSGGSADNPITLSVDTGKDVDFEVYDDVATPGNVAIVLAPSLSDVYEIVAEGTNDTFTVTYQMLTARLPANHDLIPLTAANGYEATFVPGRQIANWNYGDSVIDEALCSITLAKGERRVFETSGATSRLFMAVYDAKGNVLAKNETIDGTSFDVRTVIEAPAAGTYYVGVCNYFLLPNEPVTGNEITLRAMPADKIDGSPDEWDSGDDEIAGATGLVVLPGTSSSVPGSDGSVNGPHALSATDWYDTFAIAARKDITYRVGFEFANPEETSPYRLDVTIFTMSGSSERGVLADVIDPESGKFFEFTATANQVYYIRVRTATTLGLDYPAYNVRAVAYSSDAASPLGILTVNTPGAPSATWSIGSETVKYPSGSSVLIGGKQTVKFSSVTGYKAESSSWTGTVNPGTEPTVVEVKYSDTFDPKDDAPALATAVTLKNVDTVYASRTLWEGDVDHFSIAGTDGYFYDLALRNAEGDGAVFSITNAERGVLVEDVASVSQLLMPKTASKYIVVVKNGDGATKFGGYSLAGKFANVGAIKFAKEAVSVKEDAASVAITVNRTAKDGYVRVKYGTVAGTAKPGVDYVAQNGVLEWASGDNKAKTIVVSLIPDLVPFYEGNKSFGVQLKAFEPDERAPGEYPAAIAGAGECVVTLTETSTPGTTADDAYAKKAPKAATVKTETVALETGTYYGVIAEDGCALTNGLPQFAAVTFTASTANPAALSAKVALAGKNYTFSAKGWDAGAPDGFRTKEFLLAQKVNRIDEETGRSVSVAVTNTLRVTVATGETAAAGDWKKAGGEVELVMNVPDANNKGYQEEIRYTGAIYRDNSKIQDYLTAVTNFTGYYTLALAPEGVTSADGVPAGNGYLTLTIDNKGAVKVAGMLADGATKPSLTAKACALVPDEGSANGYSMAVPIYFAKAPAVFCGELRLYANESGKVVVDSSAALAWNNDNAKLTYAGEDGYRLSLDPVGGFYDTVVKLQAYYLNHLFEVGTADPVEFPAELLAAGYDFAAGAEPNACPVSLLGDAFATDKKVLAKVGNVYDLAASVNPCNVQVKFARATGLVNGSFSLWSENADGSVQKEITGIKHNGVLILARDAYSPIADEVQSAGFCFKAVKVTDVDQDTGKTSSRNWTFSLPFNLLGIDQGEIDPWADDWGDNLL